MNITITTATIAGGYFSISEINNKSHGSCYPRKMNTSVLIYINDSVIFRMDIGVHHQYIEEVYHDRVYLLNYGSQGISSLEEKKAVNSQYHGLEIYFDEGGVPCNINRYVEDYSDGINIELDIVDGEIRYINPVYKRVYDGVEVDLIEYFTIENNRIIPDWIDITLGIKAGLEYTGYDNFHEHSVVRKYQDLFSELFVIR